MTTPSGSMMPCLWRLSDTVFSHVSQKRLLLLSAEGRLLARFFIPHRDTYHPFTSAGPIEECVGRRRRTAELCDGFPCLSHADWPRISHRDNLRHLDHGRTNPGRHGLLDLRRFGRGVDFAPSATTQGSKERNRPCPPPRGRSAAFNC